MKGLTLAGNKREGEAPRRDHKQGKVHAAEEPKVLPKMDKHMKNLISAMQKQILKTAQESRDAASVIFDTSLGEAANSEIAASKAQGTEYNALTFGKSGHPHGPPFIWIFGGWLGDLHRQLQEEETAPKELKDDTKTAADTFGTLSVEGKAELVKFFRITSTFKKRGSPELVRVTMSFAPSSDGQKLRTLCIRLLKEIAGYEMKIGRAPPGHLEREIQEWLELMKE
jgi:hypothetical protein